MIRDALDRRSARPLALLYLNRAPEDAAFLDELDAWQREGTSFRLIPWMTEPEKTARGWNGRSGRLDPKSTDQLDFQRAPLIMIHGGSEGWVVSRFPTPHRKGAAARPAASPYLPRFALGKNPLGREAREGAAAAA